MTKVSQGVLRARYFTHTHKYTFHTHTHKQIKIKSVLRYRKNPGVSRWSVGLGLRIHTIYIRTI